MTTATDLAAAVEAAFAETGRGLEPWPDPHIDRDPFEEEYSRMQDPAKWRIVAARAEAWCLPLVLVYRAVETEEPTMVSVAAGNPAVEVGPVPVCGCDACDSGSQEELERVDDHIRSIVDGSFRHIRRGDRVITVFGPRWWAAHGDFEDDEVEAVIADPAGWSEVSGASWLGDKT